MFLIAYCVRWMERPRKNFSDEIFPHFVWEKKLTATIRFGTTAFGYFAKQNSFLSQISNQIYNSKKKINLPLPARVVGYLISVATLLRLRIVAMLYAIIHKTLTKYLNSKY